MLPLDLGEGLLLRLPGPGDSNALFRAVEENREHLRRWLTWVDAVRQPEDQARFIREGLERYAAGMLVPGLMLYEEEVAGMASLQIFPEEAIAEIGYWVAARFEGRGFVTRAAAALSRLAFEGLAIERLRIRTAVGNARSRAVALRLGFRHAGRIPPEPAAARPFELDVWELTRADWLASGKARS